MGITKQKKGLSDVAADSPSSGDSLSFAGLLSVQEQYSVTRMPPAHTKGPSKLYKQDLEFEFSVTTQCSITGSPTRIPSPDVAFSKEYFQTKANTSHPVQLQGSVKRTPDLLLPTSRSSGHRTNANVANLEKHTTGQYNGTSDNTNKKVSGSRPWFQSFVTPCRICRAHEPSRQVLPQGKLQ